MDYDVRDWYWAVGGDETRAWSSARSSYVAVDDATYLAWRAGAGLPTRIDSERSLSDVLAPHGLRGPYVDLVAYAAATRWRRETGGVTIAGVTVATDRESQAMLSGAHAYVQANPAAATIRWKSEDGFVALDAPQITALALAVGAHVQACFTAEADIAAGIESGTITTRAEIDAAFAAI
ncbi:DUF4376 domain-containing protein [Xanthobacteraceae bacterium Astr-EGSB]|uniref:DUF4376 domain-containing protein n=1 Tax=Astrobacterium formosum TaxID=3069710 RepID=UPI0027AEA230|nr:DUF4376 domain-containing protein [Xanthobacteraceae bacterium Astr-EGSB]